MHGSGDPSSYLLGEMQTIFYYFKLLWSSIVRARYAFHVILPRFRQYSILFVDHHHCSNSNNPTTTTTELDNDECRIVGSVHSLTHNPIRVCSVLCGETKKRKKNQQQHHCHCQQTDILCCSFWLTLSFCRMRQTTMAFTVHTLEFLSSCES